MNRLQVNIKQKQYKVIQNANRNKFGQRYILFYFICRYKYKQLMWNDKIKYGNKCIFIWVDITLQSYNYTKILK